MSLGAFPEVASNPSDESDFNTVQQAMCEDLLPRNSDGDPEDFAGSLGTSDYPFLKANVKTGHLANGFIVPFYDYNGLLPIPHGYMLMNGDQITRAAYNVQHRTGVSDTTDYWAIYVGSSQFEDLYLPGGEGRFLAGSDDALEDGTAPISEQGNPSSSVNLAHDHGGTLTSATSANIFSNTGTAQKYAMANNATHAHNFTLPSALSTVDVTPLSIDVKHIMRIVE